MLPVPQRMPRLTLAPDGVRRAGRAASVATRKTMQARTTPVCLPASWLRGLFTTILYSLGNSANAQGKYFQSCEPAHYGAEYAYFSTAQRPSRHNYASGRFCCAR